MTGCFCYIIMLHELGSLPEGAILDTADVVGLYPHIPHEEGLSALREALARSPNTPVPADVLVDLAELVLTKTTFHSMGNIIYKFWEQRLVQRWQLLMLTYLWEDWNRI